MGLIRPGMKMNLMNLIFQKIFDEYLNEFE
jgi:hypothetical protein